MLQFVVHYQPPQIPKLLQSYLYRYLWCLSQQSRVSTFKIGRYWPIRVSIGKSSADDQGQNKWIWSQNKEKKICEKPFGIKVKRIIINSKWLLVSGSHEINSGFHGIHFILNTGSVEKSKKRSRSVCHLEIFENAI